MARPIKETPILTGRDAINFFKNMSESDKKYISIKEKKRIAENADRLKSLEAQHSQSLDIRRVLEYVQCNANGNHIYTGQGILAMQPEIEKMLKEK